MRGTFQRWLRVGFISWLTCYTILFRMHARSCKAHFQNMLLRIVAEKVTYTFLNFHISVSNVELFMYFLCPPGNRGNETLN